VAYFFPELYGFAIVAVFYGAPIGIVLLIAFAVVLALHMTSRQKDTKT
jgi:asparagine N-glycosylation enzyme membrane subunit Stt3